MIRKYQEWLDESEQMDPAATAVPPAAPTTTPDAGAVPPAADPSALPPPAGDIAEQPADDANTDMSIDRYRELDQTRRDAIKAFKEKLEEFYQIPEEIRNNPTEESDKAKIEELKPQLTELKKTMDDAIKAWSDFNSKALGVAPGLEDEP